ncbi:MAG: hypothetical protein HDS16_01215 [Bacteroides sp.]|nr:hypothetical protein [Bacteroidales bacterium]MBD5301611.1 hypothetical protein [Bacteroides sp.]
MDEEAKIIIFAQEQGEGCNRAEYVSTTTSGDVYALSFVDDDGFPLPMGLPRLVIAKGENYNLITGEKALKMLESFNLEE